MGCVATLYSFARSLLFALNCHKLILVQVELELYSHGYSIFLFRSWGGGGGGGGNHPPCHPPSYSPGIMQYESALHVYYFLLQINHATTISSTGVSLTFGIGLASLIISVSAIVILVAVLLVLACVMRRRVQAADEPVNIELSTVVSRKQDI